MLFKYLLGLSLLSVSTALQICFESELCVLSTWCIDADNSGRGKIGPRIEMRECEKGRVCCDRVQVEAVINARLSGEGGEVVQATSIKPTTTATSVQAPASAYKSCGQGMECVPRVLCNGTINNSGKFIIRAIGARIGSDADYECQPMDSCCAIGDELTENPYLSISQNFTYKGCGYSNPNGLYVKMEGYTENESEFAAFPWMVAIMGARGRYVCGGVLIHESLVLTAAHCLENHTKDTLVLRAGEWDTSTEGEPLPHQNRRVKQVFIHENFDNESFFNDIALLVVEQKFLLAPHIQPICLPDVESSNGHAELRRANCIATGWGHGNFNNLTLPQVILKRIELPIVANEECQAMLRSTILGKRFVLRPSFLCAGGESKKDTCKGDGGSPLFCSMPDNPDRYVLAGLVSWGIGCGLDGIPGVYANVPHLRKWIDSKIQVSNFSIN